MASNSSGVIENADFIPELWANFALGLLPNYLNLANTVTKDSELTTEKVGNIIHIPKRGTVTAHQKLADTSVTKQFPQSENVDIELDQHWEVTFNIEDVAKAQANQDIMRGYVEDGVIALAEKIETKLAALYASAGHIVDAGAVIEIADLLSVRSTLVNAKYPKVAPRYGYFSPESINDILKLTEFTDVSKYGANVASMEGELGRIYGIKIFESQLTPTSGSPATIHNLVYGKDAMVLATRPLPQYAGQGAQMSVISDSQSGMQMRVSSSWDKDNLSLQVTLDVLFGVGMMRPEFLVDFQTT